MDSIPDTHTVYLVDDTQVGEAKRYCEYRRFVKWVRPEVNVSLPKAINLGASKVEGEWFVVTDNDIEFNKVAWRQIDEILVKAKQNDVSLLISQLKFVVWLVKADVFKKLLYDEYFAPAGGEDEDFLLRFCKTGYKWGQFDCLIWHQEGGHHSKGSIYSEDIQTDKFIKRYGFKPHSDEYNKIVNSGYVHLR